MCSCEYYQLQKWSAVSPRWLSRAYFNDPFHCASKRRARQCGIMLESTSEAPLVRGPLCLGTHLGHNDRWITLIILQSCRTQLNKNLENWCTFLCGMLWPSASRLIEMDISNSSSNKFCNKLQFIFEFAVQFPFFF